MQSSIGLEYRITQTLVVVIGIALIWIFNFIKQPAEQLHQVNFGSRVQLVSVTPAQSNITRGRNAEFAIRWWLLEPLPADHFISYKIRNLHHDVALLDSRNIQTTGQAYSDTPPDGILFDDTVSLPIPPNTVPGTYEVVAYLYPFEGYELDKSLGSPLFSLQRTLFIINISR